jgi:glycosyltransferase involved in cell wall biosynthesis
MKPKIAYLLQSFYIGGIETALYNLAKKLSDEFEFHFLATSNSQIHPHFDEVGTAWHTGEKWDYIVQYLKENKIDIVQYGNKIEYKECAVKAKVPIIIERTAGPRSCNLNRDGVTHVISSTKGTVPLIRKNYDGPLTVIYNGIDVEKYDNAVPDRLGFKDTDFIICYCARMGGIGQGFHILIQAVAEVREAERKNIKLVLIGDRPKSSAENVVPMLKKMAAGFGDSCVFTGALLDPSPIMAGADLYCCPALHHGISNSIIEASALSKPIIATDVGQTNEIVHNGKNGYLVKPRGVADLKDRIIQLYGSPQKRKAFGSYGKGLVFREFNIDKQATKYLKLYKKLLSGVHK